MKLFDSIDGLFAGTRYLAWGIGLVGIAASVVLLIASIPLGLASAVVFLATFLLAVAIMGIVWAANGGFPTINLIFA